MNGQVPAYCVRFGINLFFIPGGGQIVVIPHPNSERVNSVVHVGSIGAMVSYRKQTFANEEQVILLNFFWIFSSKSRHYFIKISCFSFVYISLCLYFILLKRIN